MQLGGFLRHLGTVKLEDPKTEEGKVMKKLSAQIEDNKFTIQCPKCSRKHVFTQLKYNTYYLDEDDLDTFEVTETVSNTHQLWPRVVCRNHECDWMETVVIVNF